MLFEPVSPFFATHYRVKFALEPWEKQGAKALRRRVFCDEQRIFEGDDSDGIDAVAIPIVAVSLIAGAPDEIVGTVRIHEAEPGVWYGSRLAVAPAYRRTGQLGVSLIRLAVGSAHARGCVRFLAHVQAQNSLMFQHLHWHVIGEEELHGRLHHFMQADLAHYEPIHDGLTGLTALCRRAA